MVSAWCTFNDKDELTIVAMVYEIPELGFTMVAVRYPNFRLYMSSDAETPGESFTTPFGCL